MEASSGGGLLGWRLVVVYCGGRLVVVYCGGRLVVVYWGGG